MMTGRSFVGHAPLASSEFERAQQRVAVLGGGPAGLTAALSLARDTNSKVVLFERSNSVGGNSGSFRLEGIWCDHGSHRLHPVAEPRVLSEIKTLLGNDLQWRPRHGRIRLQNNWLHFPLKPLDLAQRLPLRFTTALMLDSIAKPFRTPQGTADNFASVLRKGLGPTICNEFYYPYVRKLWGVEPTELSVTLAERRVSGSSIPKILRKVARQIPGVSSREESGFYYPRRGFGQISQKLHDSAVGHGAEIVLGAEITAIGCQDGRVTGLTYKREGCDQHVGVDKVWSTLPISMLARMIEPSAPDEVLESARHIRFRGMILIYLVLEQDRFSEYDAHYFPETSIPISRMSEPKNYSGTNRPSQRTILCAELPSDPDEPYWRLDDQTLGKHLCEWLEKVNLPVRAPLLRVTTRRLRFAYPVYDTNYERHFSTMDRWLSGISGLLTFGRQGLFAHDNTHHAMGMALAATDCLGKDGEFDRQRWAQCRTEFAAHVVED